MAFDFLSNKPLDLSSLLGYGAGPKVGTSFNGSPYSPGAGSPSVLPPAAAGGGWRDLWLGGENAEGIKTNGLAMPMLQGAGALMNGFLGMKQYGLAKEGFAENKRQFGLNYDAQRQMTNSSLEDRQRARVASNPNGYQSVGSYMDKYGVR